MNYEQFAATYPSLVDQPVAPLEYVRVGSGVVRAGILQSSCPSGQGWVLFGDSITHDGGGASYNPKLGPTSQLCMQSLGRLPFKTKMGYSGERSDQIVARLDAEIFPQNPFGILGIFGTNDVAQDMSIADSLAAHEQYILACQSRNIRLIQLYIPPNGGWPTAAATAGSVAYNKALEALYARYGVPYLNVWSDSTENNGGWVSGRSADNVHPSILANKLAATRALNLLPATLFSSPWINSIATTWSGTVLKDYVQNNNFAYDANADGNPDGWGDLPSGLTGLIEDVPQPGYGKRWTLSASFSDGVIRESFSNWRVGAFDSTKFLKVSFFWGFTPVNNIRFYATLRWFANTSLALALELVTNLRDGMSGYYEAKIPCSAVPSADRVGFSLKFDDIGGVGDSEGSAYISNLSIEIVDE